MPTFPSLSLILDRLDVIRWRYGARFLHVYFLFCFFIRSLALVLISFHLVVGLFAVSLSSPDLHRPDYISGLPVVLARVMAFYPGPISFSTSFFSLGFSLFVITALL